MRLREARIPLEGGPLQTDRVVRAPRVEIDEAEIAPDLGIVRIECRRGFQLRHGLGHPPAAVEAESFPRALRGLGPLDRGRSRLDHLTLALGISRAPVGVDEERIDGKQRGVLLARALQRRDGVPGPAGIHEGRSQPIERERILLHRHRARVRLDPAGLVALLLPGEGLSLQHVEPALRVAHAAERLEGGVGLAFLEERESEKGPASRGVRLADIALQLALDLGRRRLVGERAPEGGKTVRGVQPPILVAGDDRRPSRRAPEVDESEIVPVDEGPPGRGEPPVRIGTQALDALARIDRVVEHRRVEAVGGLKAGEVLGIGTGEVDLLAKTPRHIAAPVDDGGARGEIAPGDVAAEVKRIEEAARHADSVEIAERALGDEARVGAQADRLP